MIALLITVTASAPTAMSSVIIGLFSPSRRLASCVPIRTFERRQFRQVSPKRRVGWNFDLPAVGRTGIPVNCACCLRQPHLDAWVVCPASVEVAGGRGR
jgi:hypothetical protein